MNKIKVMIIDDSALMRNLISRILNTHNQIEVVGTAINGQFGLRKLNKFCPDLIILDLEMPEMNGIEFLQERQKLKLRTPVIILSSLAKRGAKITMDALALGASDFVLKPSHSNDHIEDTRLTLIEKILALAKPNSYISLESHSENISSPVINNRIQNLKILEDEIINDTAHLQPIREIPDIKIVVIGISTGGPAALREILPDFPSSFPVPIVIVQHMPAGFTYEFAKNLDSICKLEVKEIEENDIIKSGRIFIAPGDKHVKLANKKLANVFVLDDSPPVNGHKPSVDVLFESAASIYGREALACIMTGMGKDGAEKIGEILKQGGITIAQDQSSSIVFGMPKIAIKNNHIQLIRSKQKISETIISLINDKKINK